MCHYKIGFPTYGSLNDIISIKVEEKGNIDTQVSIVLTKTLGSTP